MHLILALGRLRQVDLLKFKTSQVYMASFRLALQSCMETVIIIARHKVQALTNVSSPFSFP